MKKKHKIVMLATDDKLKLGGLISNLRESDRLGICRYLPDIHWDKDNWKTQHLYVLSDDEIKEGDWVYDGVINEVHKVFHDTIVIGQDRKIIATTDPKLQVDNVLHVTLEKMGKIHLPQIPKSIIEYYAKHQPKEVELVYKEYGPGFPADIWFPELQDNEVVWVEPRVNVIGNKNTGNPKQYTHEEVEDFAFNTAQRCQGMNDLEIEQWIKENL